LPEGKNNDTRFRIRGDGLALGTTVFFLGVKKVSNHNTLSVMNASKWLVLQGKHVRRWWQNNHILSPAELGEIGASIVACPLSLVGVPMRAMQVCFSFVNVKQMKLLAFS
jgi:hypothetical protein